MPFLRWSLGRLYASPGGSGLGVFLPLLVLSLCLLVAVSLCCFLTFRQYLQSADRTRESVAAISALKDCLDSLAQVELAERNFLLTADPAYWEQYRHALLEVKANLGLLAREHSGPAAGARQTQLSMTRFRALVRRQTAALVRIGDLIEGHQLALAQTAVRSSEGRQRSAEVRALEHQLQRDEQGVLSASRNRSRYYARLSEFIATFGSAGIFAIVLVATIRIRQLLAARAALTSELERSNEDLQQFAYSASHDLQEPLRNLMIYSELIERRIRGGANDGLAREAQVIYQSARRMKDLLADLLAYTKVATAERENAGPLDLNQVVNQVIESLRPGLAEAEAQLEIGPLPAVKLAPAYAQQLMQNLLSNAIKYRRSGQPAQVRVWAERRASGWVISVTDNGIGIDPQYHAQIFGIFKRLHSASEYPGTGLGLAICRKIIERHDGRIWLTSAPGSGSTFSFSLPPAAFES